MRALRIYQVENRNEARLEEMRIEELSSGNVLIRAKYSSVNYKDALAATGRGKILRRFPLNGGVDVSGVVEESADKRFKAGDEVLVTGYGLSEDRDGGYADYVRVPGDYVVPLPDGLSLLEAMSLGTAGFTAGFVMRRLRDNHQTPEMGPIAVTGATGGVGSIAIDLLSQAGFEVIAITRKKDEAGAYLRQLGAHSVMTPQDLGIEDAPLASVRLGGAVDAVGGDLLAALVRSVAPYGNLVSFGLAGGYKLNTTVMPFILRGVSLLGVSSVQCPMNWRRAIWEELAGPNKPRYLEQIVKRRVGLDGLAEVFDSILAGENTGRVVVDLER